MAQLIHELVVDAAARTPAALALRDAGANIMARAVLAGELAPLFAEAAP